MARLTGPDGADRLCYTLRGDGSIGGAAGLPLTVYADAQATTLADILTTGGAAVPGSALTVDAHSLIPLFQYPDGASTVYVSVNGGPVSPVRATIAAPAGARAWSDITGKPDVITGLADLLAGKQPAGSYATATDLTATVRASDHGFAGWTFDPAAAQAGTALATAGLSHVVRFRATAAAISNLIVHVVTPGSGLTAGQCFATLHNDAGAILGGGAVTADQATNWQTSGLKIMPLVVAQAVTPGAWYRARLWFNGTTGPALARAGNIAADLANAGLTGASARFATADAGLTTAGSAPANIGTLTAGPAAWWVAAS